MTTVNDILQFLDSLAPFGTAEKWDHCGFQLGNRNQEVTKVLIALDAFEDTALEAAEIGADLLVTHHPLFFMPTTEITNETSVGRTALILASHNIASISAHTNLDVAAEGVNQVLANALGLSDISVPQSIGTDANGKAYGLLRTGAVQNQPLPQFLAHVKEALHCPGLRYVDGGKPVHKVCVGGGACADEMLDAVKAGCDTFVTSDVKYNPFWDAHDLGLNLIDAGHFYTENPVCRFLFEKISGEFPQIQVILSDKHQDCMKFF